MHTNLDHAEMDAASFEVFWRVLPPKTQYIKGSMSGLIYGHSLSKDDGGQTELKESINRFLDITRRGQLIIMPLHGPKPKHWTLLVAERTVKAEPVDLQPKGCAAESKESEWAVLTQESNKVLEGGAWQFRYYETLENQHSFCRAQAEWISKLLNPDVGKLTRVNMSRQKASDCGYWVVHFIEEEARRQRGEGKWTFAYDVKYRAERLAKITTKLQQSS